MFWPIEVEKECMNSRLNSLARLCARLHFAPRTEAIIKFVVIILRLSYRSLSSFLGVAFSIWSMLAGFQTYQMWYKPPRMTRQYSESLQHASSRAIQAPPTQARVASSIVSVLLSLFELLSSIARQSAQVMVPIIETQCWHRQGRRRCLSPCHETPEEWNH